MRRQPVYVLINTSMRMLETSAIQRQNQYLTSMRDYFLQSPYCLEEVYISTITFDCEIKLQTPLVSVSAFKNLGFEINKSDTVMLGAVLGYVSERIELELVGSSAVSKGDYKPIVLVFSNEFCGNTNCYQRALSALLSQVAGMHVFKLGSDSETMDLSQYHNLFEYKANVFLPKIFVGVLEGVFNVTS